jgi:hypothetical protein
MRDMVQPATELAVVGGHHCQVKFRLASSPTSVKIKEALASFRAQTSTSSDTLYLFNSARLPAGNRALS